MEFDKSKVYTALNADELKLGSKVFVADDLYSLKQAVEDSQHIDILEAVNPDHYGYRFDIGDCNYYMLCYLVSEPEPKGIHWTKLKIGDVIQNVSNGMIRMVTGINSFVTDGHIFAGGWLTDNALKDWDKVED